MSASSISPDEVVWIGGNDFGYLFGAARFGDEWHGFARGELPEESDTEAMIFFFPLVAESDRLQAIKKTVAFAQFGENGYGGISRWYEEFSNDAEVKAAKFEDFVCDECNRAFCEGGCWRDEHTPGACASNFI